MTACKHTISGSFSLPSRGPFHLSLTVLFAIGHVVVFSLTGWSPFLPSGFLVSRRTPDSARRASAFTYGNFTLCVIPSQVFRLAFTLASRGPYPKRISTFGLGSSDFARHYFRNHFCFLFLRVLRCFSSPALPVRSSLIRIFADHRIFAPPRNFSQLVTSFFGATYQGILRKPFVA